MTRYVWSGLLARSGPFVRRLLPPLCLLLPFFCCASVRGEEIDPAVVTDKLIFLPQADFDNIVDRHPDGVFLDYRSYRRLWELAFAGQPPATPLPDYDAAVNSASYTVAARGTTAVIRLDAAIQSSTPWQMIMLPPVIGTISAALLDGQSAPVAPAKNGLALFLPEPGLRHFRLVWQQPISSQQPLRLPRLSAAGSSVRLYIEGQAEIGRTAGVTLLRSSLGRVIVLDAASGAAAAGPNAGTEAEFYWTEPGDGEITWTASPETIYGTATRIRGGVTVIVKASGGTLHLDCRLNFTVESGLTNRLRVTLPSGTILTGARHPQLRQWTQLDSTAEFEFTGELTGRQILGLELILDKHISPPADVNLAAFGLSEPDFIPTVYALADGETELLAWPGNGWQSCMPPDPAAVIALETFETADAPLTVSLRPQTGLTHAQETVICDIQPGIVNYMTDIRITQQGPPLWEIVFDNPADLRVLNAALTSTDGAIPVSWSADGRRPDRVIFTLPQTAATAAAISLRVEWAGDAPGWPARNASAELELMPPRLVGFDTLNGFLALRVPAVIDAVAVETEGVLAAARTIAPADNGSDNTQLPSFGYRFADATARVKLKLQRASTHLNAVTMTYINVETNAIIVTAGIRFSIEGAGASRFQLRLPPGTGTQVAIDAPALKSARLAERAETADLWLVELQSEQLGEYEIRIAYERPLPTGETADVALPLIYPLQVERAENFIAVEANPAVELLAEHTQLPRAAPDRLPELTGHALKSPVVFAWRYFIDSIPPRVTITRHEPVPLPAAVIERAGFRTVVSPSGSRLTRATLAVRNTVLQYLDVQLPEDAKLWAAVVDGQGIRPGAQQRRILIPIPRQQPDSPAFEILLDYQEQKPLLAVSPCALTAPDFSIPALQTNWEVVVPIGFSLVRAGGNLNADYPIHEIGQEWLTIWEPLLLLGLTGCSPVVWRSFEQSAGSKMAVPPAPPMIDDRLFTDADSSYVQRDEVGGDVEDRVGQQNEGGVVGGVVGGVIGGVVPGAPATKPKPAPAPSEPEPSLRSQEQKAEVASSEAPADIASDSLQALGYLAGQDQERLSREEDYGKTGGTAALEQQAALPTKKASLATSGLLATDGWNSLNYQIISQGNAVRFSRAGDQARLNMLFVNDCWLPRLALLTFSAWLFAGWIWLRRRPRRAWPKLVLAGGVWWLVRTAGGPAFGVFAWPAISATLFLMLLLAIGNVRRFLRAAWKVSGPLLLLVCFAASTSADSPQTEPAPQPTTAAPITAYAPYDPTHPGRLPTQPAVFIPQEHFVSLWLKSHPPTPTPQAMPNRPPTLDNARYTVVFANLNAEITCVASVWLASDEWLDVPLPLAGVNFSKLTWDGAPVSARTAPSGMTAAVRGKGQHRLEMIYTVPVTGSFDHGEALIPLAGTTAASLIARWPLPVRGQISASDGNEPVEFSAADVSPALSVGGLDHVLLSWDNAGGVKSGGRPRITATGKLLLVMSAADNYLLCEIELSVSGAPAETLTFTVPGWIPLSWSGSDLAGWGAVNEQQAGGGTIISFKEPVIGATKLRGVFVPAARSTADAVRVSAPQIFGADRSVWTIGSAAESRLHLRTLKATGVSAQGTTALNQWQLDGIFPAADALAPGPAHGSDGSDWSLEFRASPPDTSIAVAHSDHYVVTEQQLTAEITLTADALGGPLTRLDAVLPAGVQIVHADVPNGGHWFTDPGGEVSKIVFVHPRGFPDPVAITVQLLLPLGLELPRELRIPLVRIPGAVEEGEITVELPPGVQAGSETAIGMDPCPRRGSSGNARSRCYRINAAERSLTIAVQRPPALLTGQMVSEAVARQDSIEIMSQTQIAIERGSVSDLTLWIPPELAESYDIRAEGLRDVRAEVADNGVRAILIFQAPVTAAVAVSFRALQLVPVGGVVQPALPQWEGLDRTLSYLRIISAERGIEVSATADDGARAVLDQDLPFQMSPQQALAVFEFVRPAAKLTLNVSALRQADIAEGIADRLQIDSLILGDGVVRHRAIVRLQNRREQYLRLKFPRGVTVWSVTVGGDGVKPVEDGEHLLVPMIKTGAGQLAFDIRIVYAESDDGWGLFGRREFAAPDILNIPVTRTLWTMWLPPARQVTTWKGNMLPVDEFEYQTAVAEAYLDEQTRLTNELAQGDSASQLAAMENLFTLQTEISEQMNELTSRQQRRGMVRRDERSKGYDRFQRLNERFTTNVAEQNRFEQQQTQVANLQQTKDFKQKAPTGWADKGGITGREEHLAPATTAPTVAGVNALPFDLPLTGHPFYFEKLRGNAVLGFRSRSALWTRLGIRFAAAAAFFLLAAMSSRMSWGGRLFRLVMRRRVAKVVVGVTGVGLFLLGSPLGLALIAVTVFAYLLNRRRRQAVKTG